MKIAPDEIGGVAILFARLEVLADHELKKTDRVVGHAVDINQCARVIQVERKKVSCAARNDAKCP